MKTVRLLIIQFFSVTILVGLITLCAWAWQKIFAFWATFFQ